MDDDEDQDQHEDDDDFFDSRRYRCCFSLWHAKIGTFVFSTLIFHEIILGTLYLVTNKEGKSDEDSSIPPSVLAVLVCRCLQLPCCALLYVGLWLQRHYLLLPFAVSQMTLGCFADISTFLMALNQAERRQLSLLSPFWLNIALPLLMYAALLLWLLLTLYRCFIYFRARRKHERERRAAKMPAKQHNAHQHESFI